MSKEWTPESDKDGNIQCPCEICACCSPNESVGICALSCPTFNKYWLACKEKAEATN